MKVQAKLYGTLSKFYDGYDQAEGINLEVPENTCVRDITKMVKVDEASIGIVTINGKIVKADTAVTDGDEIKFFQPIAGG